MSTWYTLICASVPFLSQALNRKHKTLLVCVSSVCFYLNKGGDWEGGEVRGSLCSRLIWDHMFSYFSLKHKIRDFRFHFVAASLLKRKERRFDPEDVTLSLSRASLRFCSRAVCSNSWAPALTGRNTWEEWQSEAKNSAEKSSKHPGEKKDRR